jgi:hypothetical protein
MTILTIDPELILSGRNNDLLAFSQQYKKYP